VLRGWRRAGHGRAGAGRRGPGPAPLLPAALRGPAIALLAACAATVLLLGAWVWHQTQAGWLDSAADARLKSALPGYRAVLRPLADIGNPVLATVITVVLAGLCLAARRWRGAVLVAVAVPAAVTLTEVVLKPVIDRRLSGHLEFPSGHTTGAFALATCCAVLLARPARARIPAAVRAVAAAAGYCVAALVAVAVVVLGFHYFTDTIGGAATGTGTVLATALILDRFARYRRLRLSRRAYGGAADVPAGETAAPGAATGA
jgi:undecaprenyl-diphosphatase